MRWSTSSRLIAGVLSKPVTPSWLFGRRGVCGTAAPIATAEAPPSGRAGAECVRRLRKALGLAPPYASRLARRDGLRADQQTTLRGKHLLLVDDNAINREVALELLTKAGIVVSIAEDGQQALDKLEHERFDGVLMDCQMPVMDGFTAARAIRQRPALRDFPVIAMTANAMVGDREKVIAAGMNDHIAKPIRSLSDRGAGRGSARADCRRAGCRTRCRCYGTRQSAAHLRLHDDPARSPPTAAPSPAPTSSAA
jgi:CheY-like chemotaxis protein